MSDFYFGILFTSPNFQTKGNASKMLTIIKSRLLMILFVGVGSIFLLKFVVNCPASVPQKQSKLQLLFQQAQVRIKPK